MLDFKSITLAEKQLFRRYVRNSRSAYNSFMYWYAWAVDDRIVYAEDEEAVYLKSYYLAGKNAYLTPFLKDPQYSIASSLSKIQQLLEPDQFIWVPQDAKDKIERDCPGLMRFEVQRDFAEYIYRTQDLINLEGHAYRSKRNRISSFGRKHPNLVYQDYEPRFYEECLALDRAWKSHKPLDIGEKVEGGATRSIEYRALERALKSVEAVGAKACVITENGRVAGFTLGCMASEDMVVIHFEKCHPEYRDMYAWMSHEFLQRCWSGVTYVNREEDLGEQGLRTSKLSYNPIGFAQHYRGIFE
ncbi:MAG: phosphatidylglycerol lysyltransferase domain-containing protein [bacterium]|nr:phosphatidylglycerol lysyltransferase domain-containing protein [bacterium]